MPESPTLLWRIKLLFMAEILPKKPHRIVHLPRPPSLASYLVLKQASLLQDSCLCDTSWRRGDSPPVPNLTTLLHSGARLHRYLHVLHQVSDWATAHTHWRSIAVRYLTLL